MSDPGADVTMLLQAWSGDDDLCCRARALIAQVLPAGMARGAFPKGVLTGDGFPLEVSFSGLDPNLRLTLDFMPDRYPPATRLSEVADFLERSKGCEIPGSLLRIMTRLQYAPATQYGAWLGARFKKGTTQYKLYSEVNLASTDEQAALLKQLGFTVPVRSRGNLSVRMLAYTPRSGQLEVYFKGQDIALYELPQLLKESGQAGQSDELLAYIERLYGHPLSERFPGQSIGLSYARAADGQQQGFSLFLPARQFWGSDARCRVKLSEFLPAGGTVRERYRRITRGLKQRNGCLTHHGMLGFVLAKEDRPQLNIGLRPWAGVSHAASDISA